MTKEQAKDALLEGKTIYHALLDEYLFINSDGVYETNEGFTISISDFWSMRKNKKWDNNWYVLETVINQ